MAETATSESRIALKRWKILSKALKQHKIDCDVPVESVRRFTSFGLLKTAKKENNSDVKGEWHECFATFNPLINVSIRYIKHALMPQDLVGFNNTGNVCVWPSEEILAYYCLKHVHLFERRSVCELGGGMTCLAGILLAASSNAKEILLTDGNTLSVSKNNAQKFGSTSVSCRELQWDHRKHSDDLEANFDFVLCADCLFFTAGRSQLLETILKILKPKGEAFIFAPSRSNTLTEFEQSAKKLATVYRIENYDNQVWELYNKFKTEKTEFEEDLHYPIMLHIVKE